MSNSMEGKPQRLPMTKLQREQFIEEARAISGLPMPDVELPSSTSEEQSSLTEDQGAVVDIPENGSNLEIQRISETVQNMTGMSRKPLRLHPDLVVDDGKDHSTEYTEPNRPIHLSLPDYTRKQIWARTRDYPGKPEIKVVNIEFERQNQRHLTKVQRHFILADLAIQAGIEAPPQYAYFVDLVKELRMIYFNQSNSNFYADDFARDIKG